MDPTWTHIQREDKQLIAATFVAIYGFLRGLLIDWAIGENIEDTVEMTNAMTPSEKRMTLFKRFRWCQGSLEEVISGCQLTANEVQQMGINGNIDTGLSFNLTKSMSPMDPRVMFDNLMFHLQDSPDLIISTWNDATEGCTQQHAGALKLVAKSDAFLTHLEGPLR